MYSIALYLYTWCALAGALFSKKIRKMIRGMAETYPLLRRHIKPDDRVVWFHAASLGEFEQGRPLMERLRAEHPEYKILLTFFSPSGFEVRKDYDGADLVVYLPFDTIGNAHSFLRLAHPEIAVFIKYEFWTNYLTIMHKKGIKVYSVSSIFREDQHFFKWYGSLKPIRQFDHLFVQNEFSKKILAEHGINQVTVVGDTRLDRVIDIKNAAADLPIVHDFVDGKKCFIAGSSWGPDEEIYIPYFAQHEDWKLIIAPHVISESHLKEIERLLDTNGIAHVRYTDIEAAKVSPDEAKGSRALIVNCFGKLSSIYRYGNAALIGGGFGVGIHNVPEAAVYGIPTIFGPNNRKFKEAQELLKCGGSFEYDSPEAFASIMDRFIAEEAVMKEAGNKAGSYINSNAGAADKCFKHIFG